MKATVTTNTLERLLKESLAGSKSQVPQFPVRLMLPLSSRHDKYLQILKILARTIHLLGRQGLALRGYCESMEYRENKDNNLGNFIEFLWEIANHSPLAEHMEKPASRNATYLSPKVRTNLLA